MKIQLDTTNKVIKLDEPSSIGELFELLENLLPNGKWKEFKLETNTIINWTSAPIIHYEYRNPYDYRPWVTYTSELYNGSNAYSLSAGTYNVEMTN